MRKIMILLAVTAFVAIGCSSSSKTSTTSSSSTSGSNSSSSQPVALSGTTNDHGTKAVSGNEISVDLNDFFFDPTFIQGQPGQTLTIHLKNAGTTTHTFTSAALGVDKTLQKGETADVQVTLPQSGATEYHCRFHQSSGMQGAVFFHAGDALSGGSGAGAGGSSSSSSSSSTAGGYDYN